MRSTSSNLFFFFVCCCCCPHFFIDFVFSSSIENLVFTSFFLSCFDKRVLLLEKVSHSNAFFLALIFIFYEKFMRIFLRNKIKKLTTFLLRGFRSSIIDIMSQQQQQQQCRSLSSLVSPKELDSALAKVKILDGSWHMPNTNRDPYKEYLQKRIVGSQFFGIDTIKDTSTDLPHMLPSPDKFADAVGKKY